MQNDAKNSLDSIANNYPQTQPGREGNRGIYRMMLKSGARRKEQRNLLANEPAVADLQSDVEQGIAHVGAIHSNYYFLPDITRALF